MQHERVKNKIPKILIVEDDKVTVDVLKLFIGNRYELDCVMDGEEALRKAKENYYDCFLMDIGLPGKMNAIETTKKLKEVNNNGNKPFIAITAYGMKGDEEHFLSQGLTHYLMKPFKQHNLLDIISEALRT